MNRLLPFILLIIFISCKNRTEKKIVDAKKESKDSPLDRCRLDYYFSEFEITPWIVVYNIDDARDVQLGKHKIKWLNKDDETKIKIDNDLFTLKDKATINTVWEKKDSVDFANNWDEIKLYRYADREIIGAKMSNHGCSGLGCSVNYFLVYDLQTKTKTFFGTFRTDDKLALYDFNNDDKLDYVSKTFGGDAGGTTPMEFIYELYSMKPNGQFVQQKNSSGLTYQIKQTTFPNDSTKNETFEQRWLTEIK